jgi:serine/threonine protein kinase
VWKLADFGLSTHVSSKSLGVTTSIRGTSGYFAPEFFKFIETGNNTASYSNEVDIWALGCILYEFVVGKRAFESDYFTLQCKFTGVLPEITLDEYFRDEDKELIQGSVTRMLSIDPVPVLGSATLPGSGTWKLVISGRVGLLPLVFNPQLSVEQKGLNRRLE